MTKQATAIIIILFLSSGVALSDNSTKIDTSFGVGAAAGDPTGITAKYTIDEETSVNMTVGWKTSDDSEFSASLDFLYHIYDLIKIPKAVSPVYIGSGFRIINRDKKESGFGIRIPVGIECLYMNRPVSLFVELVPVLDLTPDTELDFQFGVGFRYHF